MDLESFASHLVTNFFVPNRISNPSQILLVCLNNDLIENNIPFSLFIILFFQIVLSPYYLHVVGTFFPISMTQVLQNMLRHLCNAKLSGLPITPKNNRIMAFTQLFIYFHSYTPQLKLYFN